MYIIHNILCILFKIVIQIQVSRIQLIRIYGLNQ